MSGCTPGGSPSGHCTAPVLLEHVPTSSDLRFRSHLKREAIEGEIANQTFSFPSLELARMLSPKSPKSGVETAGKLVPLHQHDCMVDGQPFQEALNEAVARLGIFTPQAAEADESTSHRGLTEFLTECVKACHDSLDKRHGFPPRQERWYSELEFIVGNPDKPPHRFALPVEVGKQWRAMVSQAATYARCLFGASPTRTFALILAFNRDSNVLRFLVFHPGGLTASEEYNITQRDGLKEITRLFLTLVSWRTAGDAGAVTCYSDNAYLLPADREGSRYVSAIIEGTLSRPHCIRGRRTFVHRLRLSTNVPRVAPEPLRGRVLEPLVGSGPVPNNRVQRAGGSGGHRSQSPMPTGPMTTTGENGKPVTEERTPELAGNGSGSMTRGAPGAVSLPVTPGMMDDGHVLTDPDVQLEYVQPWKIIRSVGDPVLSELTGTVVVKTSWPGTDHRNNEADMYRDSAGRFGTIPHVCSYEGVGKHREVISNILFVPREDEIERYYWPIFTDIPPRRPDIRTLMFTVFGVEGKSLVEAKSPRQLSRSWAHFLIGWLSIYLSGHLHQDISIGNVLMVDEPVERKRFEIPKDFQDHLESLQDKKAVEVIKELCKRVEELAEGLGISEQCTAFITDGDLAVPWRDYWTEDRRGTKLGTPEFMSRSLLSHILGDRLHSPADDLESCFWVAAWSVFFNADNTKDQSEEERAIKEALAMCRKDDAMTTISAFLYGENHSNITRCFQRILLEWWLGVWDRCVLWARGVLHGKPDDASGEYYLPHSHRFALEGVVIALEVLTNHWDGEIGWESWTGPTTST